MHREIEARPAEGGGRGVVHVEAETGPAGGVERGGRQRAVGLVTMSVSVAGTSVALLLGVPELDALVGALAEAREATLDVEPKAE